VEIVHLYNCYHKEKCWSEQFNEQLTGLEYLHADVLLPGREDRRQMEITFNEMKEYGSCHLC
jgi:hypothetical protein